MDVVALGEGGALLGVQAGVVILVGGPGRAKELAPLNCQMLDGALPKEAHLDGCEQQATVEGMAGQQTTGRE